MRYHQGQRRRGAALLYQASFNVVVNTPLADYKSESGHAHVQLSGAHTVYPGYLLSGHFEDARIEIDLDPNMRIEAVTQNATGQSQGLLVRCVDVNNWVGGSYNRSAQRFEVWKRVGGTRTNLGTLSVGNSALDYNQPLFVQANGNSITVGRGVYSITRTVNNFLTATKPGIWSCSNRVYSLSAFNL